MENSKAIHFPSHLPAGLRQSPAILPADDRGGGVRCGSQGRARAADSCASELI